jgi:co-chaperonin GroES (HSP10)
MNITAAPGIYLVEPFTEETTVNTGKESEKKLLKGTIVAVGADREHDSGGKMTAVYKKGDVIRFLNYQEAYDHFKEKDAEGKYHTYYVVLFNDVRCKYDI